MLFGLTRLISLSLNDVFRPTRLGGGPRSTGNHLRHGWQLAIGNWQLAVGSWQLAVGSWQLAVGSWQLAARRAMKT